MQESYDIVLDSQLGERCGTLTIDCTDGKINGVISLVGFDNAVSGELRSGVLYLCHEMSTIVSTLKCSSVIQLIGENDRHCQHRQRCDEAAWNKKGGHIGRQLKGHYIIGVRLCQTNQSLTTIS